MIVIILTFLLLASLVGNVFLTGSVLMRGDTISGLQLETKKLEEDAASAKKAKELTPAAICQCKHGYAMHSDEKGCQERLGKTSDGVTTAQTFFCPCARYTGPVPLPAYFAPELDNL